MNNRTSAILAVSLTAHGFGSFGVGNNRQNDLIHHAFVISRFTFPTQFLKVKLPNWVAHTCKRFGLATEKVKHFGITLQVVVGGDENLRDHAVYKKPKRAPLPR
jgi:hypothetical protein